MDDFLEGGLPLGAVTEWGSPLGRGGRDVLLAWLARATSGGCRKNGQPAPKGEPTQAAEAGAGWALWVQGRAQLAAYPPAWLARGVALDRMRFATSSQPLADLRPVFLEPFFRVIVLDAPRSFSDEDCAFVARQARANGQVVVLVRDAFLGGEGGGRRAARGQELAEAEGRGNVWARLRLDCWYEPAAQQYRLRVVRGLSPRQIALDEAGVSAAPRAAARGEAKAEGTPFTAPRAAAWSEAEAGGAPLAWPWSAARGEAERASL